MAADALGAYKGQTVCYVGEGAPGIAVDAPPAASPATAGPVFLGALQRDYVLQAHLPLPRWPTVRLAALRSIAEHRNFTGVRLRRRTTA